uniref:Uncharacterized protein n=1 Tax=Arundo donax TaxID=35708 RepID=A0A0A9H5T3_ARUDO
MHFGQHCNNENTYDILQVAILGTCLLYASSEYIKSFNRIQPSTNLSIAYFCLTNMCQ